MKIKSLSFLKLQNHQLSIKKVTKRYRYVLWSSTEEKKTRYRVTQSEFRQFSKIIAGLPVRIKSDSVKAYTAPVL